MDNDFYRPQGTDSQSSDTNQTTMGQEVNQEAAGGQNTESQAQDSTYHYGRNFNSETTYHTNAAYDGAYQDNSYTQQADEHGSREPVLHLQKKTILEARRKRQRK